MFKSTIERPLKGIKRMENALRRKGKSAVEVRLFKLSQEDWLVDNAMPPMFGATLDSHRIANLMMLAQSRQMFNQAPLEGLREYINNQIVGVFKNPNSSDEAVHIAFIRTTVIAYITEVMIEQLVGSGVLQADDNFIQHANSHKAAFMNFIYDVQKRKNETGRYALSGSNYREIEEFANMAVSLMQNVYIGDWYAAYAIVYVRLLAQRMGVDVNVWM